MAALMLEEDSVKHSFTPNPFSELQIKISEPLLPHPLFWRPFHTILKFSLSTYWPLFTIQNGTSRSSSAFIIRTLYAIDPLLPFIKEYPLTFQSHTNFSLLVLCNICRNRDLHCLSKLP